MESSKLFAASSERFSCETFYLLLLGFVYFLFPVLSSNLSYLCVVVSLCLLAKTSSRQSSNSVCTWGRPCTQDPLASLQVLRLKVCNTLPRHHSFIFSFFRCMYWGGGSLGWYWACFVIDLSSTYFSKTGFLSQTQSWPPLLVSLASLRNPFHRLEVQMGCLGTRHSCGFCASKF